MLLKKRVVGMLSVMLSAAMVFNIAVMGTPRAEAASIGELNSQYSDLQQQINDLQGDLDSITDETARQQAEQQQLEQQMGIIQQQVDLLRTKIDTLNAQIAEKEQYIEQKEAEIAENEELFRQRLKAQYMSPDADGLSAVLGASTFSEMLIKADTMTRIADHDKQLIETLTQQKADLVAAKDELAASKADLESSKAELDSKNAQLAGQKSVVDANIDQLNQQKAMTESQLAQRRDELKVNQAQIEAAIKENEANNGGGGSGGGGFTPSSGVFQWPVPSCSNIYAPYGYSAIYGSEWHTGIDISGGGIYGQAIVAADDGQVVSAIYGNYGYGNYLLVYHGNGLYTLYGHCSSLAVGKGETVRRGQTIAYVGSTGNSTGPHLHFEVRQGGSYGSDVNPLNYL